MTAQPAAIGRQAAAWALDGFVAVTCALWGGALANEIAFGTAAGRTAAVAIAVVHGGSVVLRRRYPRAVMVVLLVTAVAFRLLGLPPWFLGPALLIGLYTVASRTARTSSVPALLATIVLLLLSAVGLSPGLDSLVLYAAIATGAWLLGDVVRRRQEEAALHAARATQLEAAREELAKYAVTEERLRIARELHDIVAHSMSVVALNAGAARIAADHDPAAATAALSTIEATSRSALTEMRHLLDVLRDEESEDSIAPLPGLGDLPMLVAGIADAGVAVDVSVEGERNSIPEGLDLAGYRIIQEALTNVLRHSSATAAHVSVAYLPAEVRITVADDGPARPNADEPGGSGLVGMRERVTLYGGRLDAGHTATGGFTVAASLPLPGDTA